MEPVMCERTEGSAQARMEASNCPGVLNSVETLMCAVRKDGGMKKVWALRGLKLAKGNQD